MHPKLIKANIAMFKGVSSETRRLLDEYVAEEPEAKDTPAVLWLAAQSETLHDPWIKGLRQLARRKSNDPYVQMAARALEIEARYPQVPESAPERQFFGVALWKIVSLIAIGILAAVIVVGIILSSRPPAAVATTPTASAGALPLSRPPDAVITISPELPPAIYMQGKLYINQFVVNSQRVVSLDESKVVEAMQGAQFYALNVTFQCDRGTCSTPPEANLSLTLADGAVVSARQDVKILGGEAMGPRAANARTSGWVIFEVPLAAIPKTINVSPLPFGDSVQPSVSISAPLS